MKQDNPHDRLDSWKAIAAHLGRSVRTVKRWEADEGLPVHRHLHRRQSTVFAFRSELDNWRSGRSLSADPSPGAGAGQDSPGGVLVLPFDHIGPDASQAWLADGFGEALIADLSALKTLRVLSRTSSRTLRDRRHDARSIGRRHGVRYLVEGSCRSLASRVRVSVRLVDVDLDASIWSEVFEGDVEQAFDLQSEMTSAVTQVLERKQGRALGEVEAAASPGEDIATWQCLILARQQALTWRPEGLDAAIGLLERGLQTLGESPSLLAALGRTWLQYRESAIDLGPKPLSKAHDCGRRLALAAPQHPGALQLRGWLEYCEGRVPEAIDALYQANKAQPSDPETLGLLINCLLISDRAAEARPLIEFLLSIDPLSPLTICLPGWDRLLEGDFAGALPHYEAMHATDPAHPMGRLFLVWVRLLAGKHDGLLSLAQPDDPERAGHPALKVARFVAESGLGRKDADRWLDDSIAPLGQASELIARFLAEGFAALGDFESALRWLEVAVDRGFAHRAFLERHDPMLRPLRKRAGFTRLLDRIEVRPYAGARASPR